MHRSYQILNQVFFFIEWCKKTAMGQELPCMYFLLCKLRNCDFSIKDRKSDFPF